MIKKAIFLLLTIIPTTHYSITINNWNSFYCGSAALPLSALFAYLHSQEIKRNEAEQAELKQSLTDLNVHFRDYYGYQRTGNRVDTQTIIHKLLPDIPQGISEEQSTQIDTHLHKLSVLDNKKPTPYPLFALISACGGLYLIGNSLGLLGQK